MAPQTPAVTAGNLRLLYPTKGEKLPSELRTARDAQLRSPRARDILAVPSVLRGAGGTPELPHLDHGSRWYSQVGQSIWDPESSVNVVDQPHLQYLQDPPREREWVIKYNQWQLLLAISILQTLLLLSKSLFRLSQVWVKLILLFL